MNSQKKWNDQDHFNDPEVEPVPGKPGIFRKVIKSDNTEEGSNPVPNIDEIKKEMLESDLAKIAEQNEILEEALAGRVTVEEFNEKSETHHTKIKGENLEEKKTEPKKKKKEPLNDSYEFKFK